MKWVWRIWENSLMINKRKNSFRNCIIFTRTEQEKKRKEIFQIVNSCFCVVYFVLIQFISFLKKFLTYVNYIQEKIIQKSWDLVKWLWRDFKIQISIILCIITPRIITQKHSRSQKWRSCHFGPGFATCLQAQFSKKVRLLSCHHVLYKSIHWENHRTLRQNWEPRSLNSSSLCIVT